MTKLHRLMYTTTKRWEEFHGIYQFTKCNLVLDLNCSNRADCNYSQATIYGTYVLQNYSISVSAVVLIKLYWFQTGSKPNNPSCSEQASGSAISEVCMHWLPVCIVQSVLRTALTAYRAELHSIFNCIHTKIAKPSSNPLFSEAHTGLRMFCSSAPVTRESDACPENTVCC